MCLPLRTPEPHGGRASPRPSGEARTHCLQSHDKFLPGDALVLAPLPLVKYLQDLDLTATQVGVQVCQDRRFGQPQLGCRLTDRFGSFALGEARVRQIIGLLRCTYP